MLEQLLINVLSDLLFIILIIIVGWFFYALTRRRKLFRFFGIKNDQATFTVYLSNLKVIPWGALDIHGSHRSFTGYAGPFSEMEASNYFRTLFTFLFPTAADLPGFLQKVFLSEVGVCIVPSPLTKDHIEYRSSFVAMGSSGYNVASHYVETELNSKARFKADGTAMIVGQIPAVEDPLCGFVEKIVDHERGRSVFYVAGLSELGTAGATHFLATQWSRLYKKYGADAAFAVMLRFSEHDYLEWTVEFEMGDE